MKKNLLIILSVYVLLGCNNDDTIDCSTIGCTEQFVTITVSIKDQNQNPVSLDYFEVINMENGSDITIGLSPSGLALAQQFGQYPLVEDGGVENNQEMSVQFKGFINNQEVISSNYIVGADCCHVSLISGERELILE